MIILQSAALLLALAAPVSAQPYEEGAEEISIEDAPAKRESLDLFAGAPGVFPRYVSLAHNINDFGRFADGGSDSNWYVGFNNAWIVKLPPAAPGKYARVLVGAKLGRAKARPRPDRPWELSRMPGKIYMAISQTPSFSSDQSFFLVETEDIPLEPDHNIYMPGTGRSEWFWASVPPALVSFSQPNYVIIWSPTREFQDANSAPVLAALEASAAERGGPPAAWNNRSINGVPPRSESGTLQTPINNIKPAIAIKLVPQASAPRPRASDLAAVTTPSGDVLVRFSVDGRNVSSAWVEASSDELDWRRVSPYLRQPPYLVTLPAAIVPARGVHLRAKARDVLENEGESPSLFVPPADR